MYVIKIRFLHIKYNNSVTFRLFCLKSVEPFTDYSQTTVFCVKSNLKIVLKHSKNFIRGIAT